MRNRRRDQLAWLLGLGALGMALAGTTRPALAHGHGGYVVASGPAATIAVPPQHYYNGSMAPTYAAQAPATVATPTMAAGYTPVPAYRPAPAYAPRYYAVPVMATRPVRWAWPRRGW